MAKATPWIILALAVAVSFAQGAPQQTQKTGPSAKTLAIPPTFNITPQQKARKNPIAFTDAAVEQGKKLYESQCAMCHGVKGNGRGDLASALKISPTDFTKPGVLARRTDGELFTIIGTGTGVMPAQKHRLRDSQRWEIVDFLRSLEGKTPRRATPEERDLLEHRVVVQH